MGAVNNPCYGCERRWVDGTQRCHSTCPDRAAWLAGHEKEVEARRVDAEARAASWDERNAKHRFFNHLNGRGRNG